MRVCMCVFWTECMYLKENDQQVTWIQSYKGGGREKGIEGGR